MKKIITWVKPTGEQMHLGNMLGAVLPFEEIAQGNDAAIFIADLHALTSVKDGKKLQEQSFELAIEYLAILGVDTPITIFRQSDIALLPKLNWILNNFTPYSLMLRAHSFKDAQNKNSDINMGTFNYPILMTADIIGYDIEVVPVGKDQKQHLEMARDIARNINKTYKADVVVEPKESIKKEIATIPGLDGRKMSKSYGNFIGVFDDDKTLKKKIMSIPTDSTPLEEPKDPTTCNVFHLVEYFGTKEETKEISGKYKAGNYGYGHAKMDLLDIMIRYITPYREAREQILKNPKIVHEKLQEGAEIMNKRMNTMMKRLEQYIGI